MAYVSSGGQMVSTSSVSQAGTCLKSEVFLLRGPEMSCFLKVVLSIEA